MSSCRCAYVVPASYAKNIKIDTKQDIVLPEDANLWPQFHDLRPRFVHYVGNNPAIFDFVKQTQALCLRWQPQSSMNIEINGLNQLILQLVLTEPLRLRCNDDSFREIHLSLGEDFFMPHFGLGLPHMVIKADARTGRIPPLPALYGASHLSINHPWNAKSQANDVAFDCRQLKPYAHLNHLKLNGNMQMWSALTQLPLRKLEVFNAPNLSEFPLLTDMPNLQELTVAGSETEGSKHINYLSKQKQDLVVYFQDTVDSSTWQQAGYIYQQHDNQTAPSVNPVWAQSMAPVDLSDVAWNEDASAADANNPTLFERMRTESVTAFFGFKSKHGDEKSEEQEPSLLERMRTESVGDFFRNKRK